MGQEINQGGQDLLDDIGSGSRILVPAQVGHGPREVAEESLFDAGCGSNFLFRWPVKIKFDSFMDRLLTELHQISGAVNI